MWRESSESHPTGKHENPIMFRHFAGICRNLHEFACNSHKFALVFNLRNTNCKTDNREVVISVLTFVGGLN